MKEKDQAHILHYGHTLLCVSYLIGLFEMVKIHIFKEEKRNSMDVLVLCLLSLCDSSSTLKVIFLYSRGCDVVYLFVVGDCEDKNAVL